MNKEEMRAVGSPITANSVNIIQNTLNEITSLWGIPSSGQQTAKPGEITRASLINTWISWLKSYSGRIGCSNLTNSIANVNAGEPMRETKINEINSSAINVRNHCNRAECNDSECQYSECCNDWESQNSECSYSECSDFESNSSESCDSEY